jgi:GT2 family glycosyltransferase
VFFFTVWDRFNNVYWTMAVEVQFYLVLPGLAWLTYRLARWVRPIPAVVLMVMGLSLVSAVSTILDKRVPYIPYVSSWLINRTGLPFWISVFAMGMACSMAYAYCTQIAHFTPRQLQLLATWSAGLLASGVMLGLGIACVPRLHDLPFKNQLFGFVYGGLLLGVLFGPALPRAFFASRPLRFVGLISYSVYLWHQVLLYAIEPHLATIASVPGRMLVMFALGTLVCLPVAYLSFQLCERPFLRARKRAHESVSAEGQTVGSTALATVVDTTPAVGLDTLSMGPEPLASVIIPTHGRRASLVRVLRALGRQCNLTPVFEVVVVCDGDVDGSIAACRALAAELPYSLRVFEQVNQGPAAARNRGVAEARAPLIIFLDDDVVPDDGLIAAHLKAQAGQDVRVTLGPLLPPPDARLNAWGAWEEQTLCRQYAEMLADQWQPTYRQFYTGNASVLRHHLIEAGGFNTAFRRAEDVELGLRLHDRGLHYVFLPEARGWHYVQRSFASWKQMAVSYGEADVWLARTVHAWVLELVAQTLAQRQFANRAVSQLCAGRPIAIAAVSALFGLLARVAYRVRLEKIAMRLCSALFNLRYHHGVAQALGGRAAFLRLVGGEAVAEFIQSAPDQQLVGVP